MEVALGSCTGSRARKTNPNSRHCSPEEDAVAIELDAPHRHLDAAERVQQPAPEDGRQAGQHADDDRVQGEVLRRGGPIPHGVHQQARHGQLVDRVEEACQQQEQRRHEPFVSHQPGGHQPPEQVVPHPPEERHAQEGPAAQAVDPVAQEQEASRPRQRRPGGKPEDRAVRQVNLLAREDDYEGDDGGDEDLNGGAQAQQAREGDVAQQAQPGDRWWMERAVRPGGRHGDAVQKIEADGAADEAEAEDEGIGAQVAVVEQDHPRDAQRGHAGQATVGAVAAEVVAAQRARHQGGHPRQPRAGGDPPQHREDEQVHDQQHNDDRRGKPEGGHGQHHEEDQGNDTAGPALHHQVAVADVFGVRRDEQLERRGKGRQSGQET